MSRIAAFSIRHARWVFVLTVVLVALGAAASGGLSNHLSQTFSLPGQPGYEADQKILAEYGGGGAAPPTVLAVRLPAGHRVTDRAVVADLAHGSTAAASQLAKAAMATTDGRVSTVRVVAYRGPADRVLLGDDGRTTYVLAFPFSTGGFTDAVLGQEFARGFARAARLPAGTEVYTTGITALSESGGGHGSSSVLVETAIGAVGALIVLAFVFGSFLALVPLLMALTSILSTFLLVRGLASLTDVSVIVQFLIALIGLGVAIDYSLIVVTRWREERANGRDNEAAVLEAIRTAGHSVVFSGVTVAVGLLALVALPVPFLRSVGYGGVLIPLVSIVVSLTLLPALLVKAGPFLDRPRRKKARSAAAPSRAWTWWATTVVRHRWLAAGAGLAVLLVLAGFALTIRVGEPQTSSLAGSGPASTGLHTLAAADVESGALTPIEVLTTPAAAERVSAATSALAGVRGVIETGRAPGSVILDVIPEAETSSSGGEAVLDRVQSVAEPLGASVGGTGADSEAFSDAVYGSFPLMLAIIVLVTFVLLARAFRSLLLPLKAVVLNLLSVGATYGLLVLLWQDGHGSDLIWGVPATGAITSFVPLMVFAFLFGLSMDYEVFILARMREEYDESGSTPQAVIAGLGRTGRLVTSAALILFLSFLSLSQGPEVDIKVFATGLGGGILLDATIVRALLVPALVSLFGRANWWLPPSVARILRVEPSGGRTEQPVADSPPAEFSKA